MFNLPDIEKEILEFWKKDKTFQKSLDKESPNGDYVFYDGPPFATGLPHYGHILGSTTKDVVGRYWTMRGYHVARTWGWDCHGLPVENIVEKELGINSKKEIEDIGVAKFNETCRDQVLTYVNEWGKTVERIGRWVDFENSYKTMDNSYIESVWWAFKQIWDKGLIYEGKKVLLNCPRCETPIAKAEVAMDNSYQDVTEDSIYIKFKIKDSTDDYFLAWTTTPWTLPGNMALAVDKDIVYAKVKTSGGNLILAKDLIEKVVEEEYELIEEYKGSDLVGMTYEPLYELAGARDGGGPVYQVIEAGFVTTEEGTGVVHTAVVYGEDDYELGMKVGLPIIPMLDQKAVFLNNVPEFLHGVYFKDADKLVIEDLTARKLAYKIALNTHSYPHCYRCDTPLFYNAIDAWFINIQKVKPRLLELNEKLNWYPDHLKHGRFQKSVEAAPDWNISRNRYWASPIPIWRCESCNHIEVIGSADDLFKRAQTNKPTKLVFVRHGESEKNIIGLMTQEREKHPLTEQGREHAHSYAKQLADMPIDAAYVSPLVRAKETAELILKGRGLTTAIDDRLIDEHSGEWEGKTMDDFKDDPYRKEFYQAWLDGDDNVFAMKRGKTGESFDDILKRTKEFLDEIVTKNQGETVLIVAHGANILNALRYYRQLSAGQTFNTFLNRIPVGADPVTIYISSENKELDLHKQVVDTIEITCEKCSSSMKRTSEVMDVWFESASMPYAAVHYPFENKEWLEKNFPAQFIAEYTGQVRTWFYYMLVLSAILFDEIPFENIVVTGTILGEDGQKMSKSRKNFPDPWNIFNEYGVDALRYYLMGNTVMNAGDISFSEQTLKEKSRIFITLLNVVSFYEMFAKDTDVGDIEQKDLTNVLDVWILARTNETIRTVTEKMDGYDIVNATREFEGFINDLSTWYVRRSRDRFKSDNDSVRLPAVSTLRHVIFNIARLMAPITPFIAEYIYRDKMNGTEGSVHLRPWPEPYLENTQNHSNILENMRITRQVVEMGLAERTEKKLPVRQPLNKIKIYDSKIKIGDEYIELIKEELNIKEVVVEAREGEMSVELDTEISPELKREGIKRELVRQINNQRKKSGLTIEDRVKVAVVTDNEEIKQALKEYTDEILADTLAIEFIDSAEAYEEAKVNGETIQIGIVK